MSARSFVVAVLAADGATAVEVDEGSKRAALEIARRASDPADPVAVRGLKGATRVTEFRGTACMVIARFVAGGRI